MYALVFDLGTQVLQKVDHNASFNNAYADIRMPRIEQLNDLMPAITQVVAMKRGNAF